MEEVRVRFPPSPTGYLHIGGARTALFNWLFARQRGGKFVLRIEDTDVERSTDASTRGILEGLQWMGIDWDEGPYLQSEYAQEHRDTAEQLIKLGAAYRCYCTKEELAAKREAARAAKKDHFGYDGTCRDLGPEERAQYEAEARPSVVRFRVPDELSAVSFDDLVFGHYQVRREEIDDFVIVRSTGQPLYILSNVVDDHRDRISHVIRGADHLTNTPRQVLLYRALGWTVPSFGHIALTLDSKKAKISKRRHGEVVAVQFYKEAGFLPWAFCNFMALLGWSPGDDREFFGDQQELMDAFSLEGLNRSNSVFNHQPGHPKFITDPKALHINEQHLRSMPVAQLFPFIKERFQQAGFWSDAWDEGGEERDWFMTTVEMIRVRYHLLSDFVDLGRAYFDDQFPMEEKALRKGLRKNPALKQYLPQLADRFEALEVFNMETTDTALRALADELQVKAGVLINGARAAVSGQAVGPGIFDLVCAVGQRRTVQRLRDAAALI